MIEHFFPNPVVLERLHAGPLGTDIDAFAQQLSERGYAVWTAQYAMRLLAALGTWLVQKDLAITDLDEPALEAFLLWRYREFRQHRDDRSVLALLLEYLREKGVVVPALEHQAADEGSRIREAFHCHLITQRNPALSTVRTYLDTVGDFLDWRFAKQSLELGALCAQDVNGFMLEQARRYSAAHTQLIASGLRGFLRFLLQNGNIAADLSQYVPAPARRQLSGLPKFMPAEDVERLLQSIDQDHPAPP
jgi:integrase